ncbi:MAG: PEGA domain-containing protein [Candidatus Brocadiia bacterium]
MSLHEDDTVETQAPPVRARRSPWAGALVLGVLLLAAGVAIVYSPTLQVLLGVRSAPRPGGQQAPQGRRGEAAEAPGGASALIERLGLGEDRPLAVTITSEPEEADVFVDEEHVGTTPVDTRLSPASHAVRIVRRGHRPWLGQLDPRDEDHLSAELEPLRLGSLPVRSEPEGAAVYLDGGYRGQTPVTLNNLSPGSHTLRLAKEPAYRAVTREIEVRPGPTPPLSVRLEPTLERYYRQRIKENPQVLGNYTELLHLYVLEREPEKAIPILPQAVRALKGDEVGETEMGQFFREVRAIYQGEAGPLDDAQRQEMVQAGLQLLRAILASEPEESSTYTSLATLLVAAGQAEAVMKICDEMTKEAKVPGYVHIRVGRAVASSMGATSGLPFLQRAVELNPDYYSAHYYLADGYHDAERLDDALREYRTAEKLLKTSSSYRRGLLHTRIADVLADRGDVKEAIGRYQQALELKAPPAYAAQWRSDFAELLADQGRTEQAVEQYEKVQKMVPDSRTARLARYAIYRLRKKKKKKD